jgi:hypothetical protein
VVLILALALFMAVRNSSPATANATSPQQAVIVQFDYGNKDWAPFFEFEKGFEAAISESGLGDYDGNELATDGNDGYMYIYGPDADKLFAFVKPRLPSVKILKNIRVTLRYGAADDPHAREAHVRLGS